MGEQLGQPRPHGCPGRSAERHEGVQGRRLEHVTAVETFGGGKRREVDDVVAEGDAHPGLLVGRGEHAVREVLHRERRVRGNVQPGHATPPDRPSASSSSIGSVTRTAAEGPERPADGEAVQLGPREHPLDEPVHVALGETGDHDVEVLARQCVGGRDQHVEHAVLLEPGLRLGPADDVVQARGQLERQPALDGRDQEVGQRRLGGERVRGRAAGAVLAGLPAGAGSDEVQRQPHVARVDLEVAGHRRHPPHGCADGGGVVAEPCVRRLDGHQRDAIVGGRGAQGLGGDGRAVVDDQGHRQVLVGRQGLAQLGEAGRRAQERPDEPGVRRAPVPGMPGNRLRQRGVGRREEGRVVDEAGEQAAGGGGHPGTLPRPEAGGCG